MKNKKRLKFFIRIALFAGTAISMFFVPWILIKAYLMPLPKTVQEQVNEAIEYGFDGIIVYIDQAGHEPEFYAAGWKNREKKIPADPHALFKIASIAKLYDALTITKLVHDKKLSLDKTITDYLPELAGKITNAEKITLRMLVQHRSGIPNFTNIPEFWSNPPQSTQEVLELVYGVPANFEPGEDYEYSNTNYVLLHEIMERVLGYNRYKYMREHIFLPLGLKHTYGSIHEINMDSLMSGYYVGVNKDIKDVDYGSMIATAEDVGKFVRALNDGTAFREGERELYASLYVFDHTGLIPGYQSIARYHKDMDAVIVQFVNTTNFDGYEWSLGEIIYNRIVKIVRKRKN